METIQQFQASSQPTENFSFPVIVISILIPALGVGLSVFFLQKAHFENLLTGYKNEIQQLKTQISILEANKNIPEPSQNLPEANSPNVINCKNDYDCLYTQISKGNPAIVSITETIDSLSLEEKSEVKIEPVNNQFRVAMSVLELNKIKQTQPMTKSIVGSVSENCPQIVNNLTAIEMTSASCMTNTAEEAKNLAVNGLSDSAISKYDCKGNLIDEIKRICVKPDFPHFPPGVKKPAIYLYPLEKTKVIVSVDLKGVMTKSEPTYYKRWEVTADSNGVVDGKYDYLFYEAELENLQLPKEGWVVKYDDLDNWFDFNLKELGLNNKEISQFKEYWLAELPTANYYEIKLLEDSFLFENMNLIIDPKPTTVIRRNLYFKPLKSQISIEQPNLVTPMRKGFTVVEWGGLLDE